jgi:hypothetical protein
MLTSPSLYRLAATATTAHKSVAPFLGHQIRFSQLFAAELLHEINECQCLSHGRLGLLLENNTLTSQLVSEVYTVPLIRN